MSAAADKTAERAARVLAANQLLRVIGSHGRRFFHYGGSQVLDRATGESHFEPADRYAYFELDARGKLWFVDDYSQKRICMQRTGFVGQWRGFSHGGTLRALVEDIAAYISRGMPVPRWRIVIESQGRSGVAGNVWGYSEQAALAVRAEAYALPMFAPPVAEAVPMS